MKNPQFITIRGHHLKMLYDWWISGPKWVKSKMEIHNIPQYGERMVKQEIALLELLDKEPNLIIKLIAQEKDTVCSYCPREENCFDDPRRFNIDEDYIRYYGFKVGEELTAENLKRRILERFAKNPERKV